MTRWREWCDERALRKFERECERFIIWLRDWDNWAQRVRGGK